MIGNFGAGRRTGGSSLNDVLVSSKENVGNFPTQDEYLVRLRSAFHKTDDLKLRQFILAEISKIERKSSHFETRVGPPPQGPYCDLQSHFVGSHQTCKESS